MAIVQRLNKTHITQLGYLEETTAEGTIETSGSMNYFGSLVGFTYYDSIDTITVPGGSAQDAREFIYTNEVGLADIAFGVYDNTMIKYVSNLPNGAGTVDNSVSLAAKVDEAKIGGSTKYWLMEFARPARATITSGQGRAVLCTVSFVGKQAYPLLSAWTSKPTMASDPGIASKPTWKFTTPATPVTWDGSELTDIQGISVSFDRGLVFDWSSGGEALTVNECTRRDIRWSIACGYDSEFINLKADHDAGTAKTIVWTINTDVLTLSNCTIDPIPLDFIPMGGDPSLVVPMTGTATTAAWT